MSGGPRSRACESVSESSLPLPRAARVGPLGAEGSGGDTNATALGPLPEPGAHPALTMLETDPPFPSPGARLFSGPRRGGLSPCGVRVCVGVAYVVGTNLKPCLSSNHAGSEALHAISSHALNSSAGIMGMGLVEKSRHLHSEGNNANRAFSANPSQG